MKQDLVSELAKIVKEYHVCVKEKRPSDEIYINRTKEPLFKILLAKIINEETRHEESDLSLSLAFLMEVSPYDYRTIFGKGVF